jgi:mono/diheme cytochrome c family protein
MLVERRLLPPCLCGSASLREKFFSSGGFHQTCNLLPRLPMLSRHWLALGFLACVPCASAAPLDYNRDIKPILAKNCFACHGPDDAHRAAGLRLDQRDAATKARKRGPALVAHKPDASLLVQRILSTDEAERMPPPEANDRLTPAQIATLKQWISEGAGYAEHWAFVAPTRPTPAGNGQPIDAFIRARLAAAQLPPAPPADAFTLVRRLSLDLRGLPPTPHEVDEFVRDQRPDAYARLIERFLADPAYGERWARMWLDLARYADSAGYGSDPLRPQMWRYRDWVIGAFNRNLPYDQFTREQLAGDLLPNATLEQRVATAFHRNTMTNTEGGTDDEEYRVVAIKDRTDTTFQVWMGLTVGCAKCHTHKFDPITQTEYYRLYALFNQTADNDRGDESPTMPAPTPEQAALLAKLEAQLADLRRQLHAPSAEIDQAQAAWERSLRLDLTGPELSLQSVPGWNVPVVQTTSTLTGFRVPAGQDAVKIRVGPAGTADLPPMGRFVRIELPGKDRILSLAEVQVFRGTENLARKGVAKQSSTAFDGPAKLAIDGNTSGDYAGGKSVTHTATEANPWWELDLGAVGSIEKLVIWNRTDGGAGSRLKDVRVQLLDANRQTVWNQTVAAPPEPSVALVPSATLDLRVADQYALGESRILILEKPFTPTAEQVLSLSVAGPIQALTDARLTQRLSVPPAVRAALDAPQRTPEQAQTLREHYRTLSPALAQLRGQISQLEKQRPTPVQLPVLSELPANQRRTTKLLIKGDFLNPGAVVTPGTPAAFPPLPPGTVDRLALANWLMAPENPLTARVAVNRLWAQLFGAGLVESEEDFGTQGELPSHPELLDWLATEYVRLKWDTKALLKTIVLSETYRQSARVTPTALAGDPRNRLLSRAPRYRLEAEMVRDQALALSGLLHTHVGGPSVYPTQPAGLWQAAFNGQRTWPTSTGNDRYRRGLYTFWRRTIPYPSMATFDAPSRETCTVRRVRTNTPLQAFVTLNDPVYVEAAQALARRLMREGGASAEERIRFGLQLCLARPAQPQQVQALLALYQAEYARLQADAKAAQALATEPLGPLPPGVEPAAAAAWTVVANVLLNLDGVLTKG